MTVDRELATTMIVQQERSSTLRRVSRLATATCRWVWLWLTIPKLRHNPFFRLDDHMTFEVTPSADISFGRRVHFRGGGHLYSQGKLSIGSDVFVNHGAVISNLYSISIGSRVRIGERVSIHDENHIYGPDRTDWSTYQVNGVRVEDDVWIGAGAVLLPGAVVNRGSVVAAGTIVRGIVPASTLVGGNPMREIRKLKKTFPHSDPGTGGS